MASENIVDIVITYEDGSSKRVDKGMVVSTTRINQEEVSVNLAICNLNSEEMFEHMENIIEAYAQLKGIEL